MTPDPTIARKKYLDELEDEGRGADVQTLVEAIVRPIAGRLSLEPQSEFARFAASMTPRINSSSSDVDTLDPADQRTIRGLREALAHLPESVVANRIDTAFNMIVNVFAVYELRRAESLDCGPASLDDLADTLIVMVTAALTA